MGGGLAGEARGGCIRSGNGRPALHGDGHDPATPAGRIRAAGLGLAAVGCLYVPPRQARSLPRLHLVVRLEAGRSGAPAGAGLGALRLGD